jgi:hypothetical protein
MQTSTLQRNGDRNIVMVSWYVSTGTCGYVPHCLLGTYACVPTSLHFTSRGGQDLDRLCLTMPIVSETSSFEEEEEVEERTGAGTSEERLSSEEVTIEFPLF